MTEIVLTQQQVDCKHKEVTVAAHLLAHYGYPGGYRAGSFSEALIKALECADTINTMKIFSAFPEYQTPVVLMKHSGHEALTRFMQAVQAELEELT